MLADRGTSTPKTRDGYVEALRVLRTARTSAMKARTALLNQISGALTSAADEVRSKYRGMTSEARVRAMAASRPAGDPADPVVATLMTLKRLGTPHRFLSEEIAETDAELAAIISVHAPVILEVNGVGAVLASQLLVTFGDNPERMESEAAFAALAGVAPVPASSGAVPGGNGFYKDWRLVAVDGTTMDLADTPANEKAYGRPGTKTQFKSAFPQARLLGLVECGTHAAFSTVVASYNTSEHDMYPGLLADLAEGMLLTSDRGFFSYQGWKDSIATGAELLWRMKANSVLPSMEELGDGSYRSAVYPSSKDRAKKTAGIPVRVIEHEVTTDGGETASSFRLITSLLDPVLAPAEDLADLYAKRWEIESSFGELKTHQRGPGNVLRSKTPDGVLQEIYGHLCTHYAIRSLIGTVAHEFDEDPLKFSFKRTLRAARRSLAGRPAFSPSEAG